MTFRRPRRLLPLLALFALFPFMVFAARGGDPASQVEFGVKAAKKGLWREALFRWEKALRLSPDNPRILNNLAVAHETSGDFEKAEELYQAALRREPENRDIRQNYELFSAFYKDFRARKEREKTREEPSPSRPGEDFPAESGEKRPDAPPPA